MQRGEDTFTFSAFIKNGQVFNSRKPTGLKAVEIQSMNPESLYTRPWC